MPVPPRFQQHEDQLEIDHDRWPAGHYRGRGNSQDHTGPHEKWIGPYFGQYMVLPGPQPPRKAARGPRGYRRSDARLSEEVYERLSSLGNVEDTRDVAIDVKDAVVTLRGYVRDRRAKRVIEDEAAAVWGVEDVVNELVVDPNRNIQDENAWAR